MNYRKGLKYLRSRLNGTTLSALATRTALVIGAAYDGMDAPFLGKAISVECTINQNAGSAGGALAENDGILIGLAQGNLSVTEIKEALEANLSLIEDPAEAIDFVKVDNWIVNKSLRVFVPTIGVTDGTANSWMVQHLSYRVDLGKGILFPENVGFQWFVYNCNGASLTTGEISGLVTVEGVFLND